MAERAATMSWYDEMVAAGRSDPNVQTCCW